MVQEQVGLLKREGGWHFFYFFYGLSFLHLEITLFFEKLCYPFEEKKNFFVTMILWKKSFEFV